MAEKILKANHMGGKTSDSEQMKNGSRKKNVEKQTYEEGEVKLRISEAMQREPH